MSRIDILREYLQQNPSDNFLQHALALEYIKEGRDNDAKDLFEEILARDPGYIGSYYHLAKLYERMNNTSRAIHWYEKGMNAAREKQEMHLLSELKSAYDELMY